MTPLGAQAISNPMDPWWLLTLAAQAPENEREDWEGMANTLATIRNLPTDAAELARLKAAKDEAIREAHNFMNQLFGERDA